MQAPFDPTFALLGILLQVILQNGLCTRRYQTIHCGGFSLFACLALFLIAKAGKAIKCSPLGPSSPIQGVALPLKDEEALHLLL